MRGGGDDVVEFDELGCRLVSSGGQNEVALEVEVCGNYSKVAGCGFFREGSIDAVYYEAEVWFGLVGQPVG